VKSVLRRGRWEPLENARGRTVSIDGSFQILMDQGFAMFHGENIKRRLFMTVLTRSYNVLAWNTLTFDEEFS
jgi:hypothetical protein